MKRRVNGKFGVVLGSVLVAVGVGVHFLHGYQLRRHAGIFLWQADRAGAEGRRDQELEYLRRYLTLAPRDTEALARYGLALKEQATTRAGRLHAFLILEQVLRREPGRTAVRRQLVPLAMDLGLFTDAAVHLDILLKETPDDGELELLFGRCKEENREYPQALEYYTRATLHTPRPHDGYVRLAHLYRQQFKDPDQADRVMDRLVQDHAAAYPAYLARARYRSQFGLPGVAEDWQRARTLAPEELEVLLAAAELPLEREAIDEARQGLEAVRTRAVREPRWYRAMATLELKAGRWERAVGYLRDGIAAFPRQHDLGWNLADLLIQGGKADEARVIVRDLRRAGYAPELLDFLEARLLVQQGAWSSAAECLEDLRPRLLKYTELPRQVDLLLGLCYTRLGDVERQLAAFQRAVDADRSWVQAHEGLAAAFLAAGRLDDALGQYRRLMTLRDAPPGGWIMLARLLIVRNLREPAARRDWDEVHRVLDQAARVLPAATDIPLLRAEVLVAQNRPDRAQELLEQTRDQRPDVIDFWNALATLAERRGEPESALRLLDQAKPAVGDTVNWRLAYAAYWTRRGGAGAREHLAALEKGADVFTPEDQARLRHALAEGYYHLGAEAEAERLWGELASQRPDDLRARIALFDLALQRGDDDQLRHWLGEMRRVEGEHGAMWRYGEAVLALRQARQGDPSQLGDAARLLAEVARRRPSWARVPTLEAEVSELEGNAERALEKYLRAVELGERQPTVIRRAVQLLSERRRYLEAEQLLGRLQEQMPLTGDLQRLASAVSQHTRGRERALELARQAVADEPDDPHHRLWLGQLLWSMRHVEEAEQAFREAVRVADDIPDTWVALVQHLARTRQTEAANAALEEAAKKLPPDQAPIALAQCYEALGRHDRAEQYYRAALAAQPGDIRVLRNAAAFYLRVNQPHKAEPALRKVLDPQTKAAPEEVAWARRSLALGLAMKGGADQFRGALALLDKNAQGGLSVEDQRAKAVVLATRPGRRREAIRLLEDLAGRQPPTADEQFLLAQLYEADRDWPRARDRMLSLLAAHGDNPHYLAYFVRGLLRHGEVTAARDWLERLEKVEPASFRTAEIKARVLVQLSRQDEAVALLRAVARQDPVFIRHAARGLDELGQKADAEELYRQFARESKASAAALVLAEFLGRQNQLEEALSLCERAWANCPSEAVASVCVAALRSEKATPAHFERVERWIEAALEKDPQSVGLLMSLAELRYLQARYPDVVTLYRRILALDGQNVVALNNLAWLLALRYGQGAEALELIERSIAVAGPESDLLDTRSVTYLTVGERDLVIRDLVPDLLDTRAVIYLTVGQKDLAIKDLEEAIARTPTSYRYFHLAQAYHQARNRNAATNAFLRARALGLKRDHLHVLEQPTYQQLAKELAVD
jgi:tetratricopeptide (TPR) repeat protein